RLLPVKVLGASGEGSYEGVIKGIIYAVDQGAKVINMSLAGRNESNALRDAARYAYERGVVVVAAAGNSGSSVEFPAAYDDFVVAVGATRFDNTITAYSNFGPQIDIMAPGGDISVDQNGDGFGDGVLQNTRSSSGTGYSYRFFEGTSMASPHVAGVAALLFAVKPGANPDEIKTVIMQTADNNPTIGPEGQFGAGLLQAANAIAAISETTGGPTATHTPTPTPTSEIPTETPTPTDTTEPVDEHDGDIPTDTPTPTVTPTPTGTAVTPAPPQPTTPAPPPQAGELLTNGSFESDEGWVFGDTPIRGGYNTDTIHSGSRAALVGAVSGPDRFSFTSVWQRVTIPAEAQQVMLEAYIYPISQDSPGTDAQNIMILNEDFRVIKTLSSDLSNSQTWEQRTYDLSDLAGRTIYVYFSVVNRGNGRLSAMYVDDVSLRWSQ
ncbi:MAG: S8 family serine peptidase, partial [Anaerolineae bacterium]|nr:S8 family serine peptidase [Anaerolineae bacterium]